MTDRFFWRGIRTDEDALIKAMNVAEDYLVEEYWDRKAKQRAEQELELLKLLEASTAEMREKCEALWSLIKNGDDKIATRLLAAGAGEGVLLMPTPI